MASIAVNLNIAPPEIKPAQVFGDQGSVRLRIATGGIGTTGLLQKLCDAFLKDHHATSSSFRASPWKIAWLLTDTSLSYNALASRSADIAITFHPYADLIAVAQGVADRREYIFRDAFCLVGPRSNPANLPTDSGLSIYELFTLLFCAAIESLTTSNPIRFLSRYDKSANNILESRIWTTIGQTPWSDPHSTFYHRFSGYPLPALRAANALGEYTLVDRGTWVSCDSGVKESLVCYKEGAITGDDLAASTFEAGCEYRLNPDGLSNPAHALLGKHCEFREEGSIFLDWLLSEDGGRSVIEQLKWNSLQGYGLPPRTLERSSGRTSQEATSKHGRVGASRPFGTIEKTAVSE